MSFRFDTKPNSRRTIVAVVDDIRVLLRFLVVVNHMGDPPCSVIGNSVAFFAAEQHFVVFVPDQTSGLTLVLTDA